MIDRNIKRAATLTFVVVIVAKASSLLFDTWMDDSQDQMIDNHEKFELHQRGLVTSQNRARVQANIAENCRTFMTVAPCFRPRDFQEVEECLLSLQTRSCNQLPYVNLCAAVEELQLCADVFADQNENGCDRLRRYADCVHHPTPPDRERLWKIRLHDGLWDGKG